MLSEPRPMIVRGGSLIPPEQDVVRPLPGEATEMVMCRILNPTTA